MNEEIKNLALTVNGISKTYAMPGLRIGYAAGPENIIKAMTNVQSQSTSNPSSMAQEAAIEALNGPQDYAEKMRQEFKKRRDFIFDALNKIGLSCKKPEGAFYIFPRIKTDSVDFANKLLDKEKVAVVPGVFFGKEKHIRISYATSIETIQKGVERIKRFI